MLRRLSGDVFAHPQLNRTFSFMEILLSAFFYLGHDVLSRQTKPAALFSVLCCGLSPFSSFIPLYDLDHWSSQTIPKSNSSRVNKCDILLFFAQTIPLKNHFWMQISRTKDVTTISYDSSLHTSMWDGFFTMSEARVHCRNIIMYWAWRVKDREIRVAWFIQRRWCGKRVAMETVPWVSVNCESKWMWPIKDSEFSQGMIFNHRHY